VKAKDGLGLALVNARVYRDGSYYGTTNSSGNITVPTTDSGCGKIHAIKVYCAKGNYCGTQSTMINFNNDNDYLYFTCGMCQSNTPKLRVTASAKASYYLNDQIALSITVKDESGKLINGAKIALYNPFRGINVYRTTSNGGRYTYNTTASKIGTLRFFVTVSKSGYKTGSTSKSVSVSQVNRRIIVNVRDALWKPVITGKVYLDGIYKGKTDNSGKITLNTGKGTHKVKVRCPNNDYCSTRRVYVNNLLSIYFKCACNDSDGDGYENADEKLAGSDPNAPNSTPFTVVGQYNQYYKKIMYARPNELIYYYFNTVSTLNINSDNKISTAEISEESIAMPVSVFYGFIIGLGGGAISNVRDLFVFLWDAFWYLMHNSNNNIKIAYDVTKFFGTLGNLNSDILQTMWDSYWKDKLREGAQYNSYFTFDEQDKTAFNNSYVIGYTTSYVVLSFIGGKGAKGAISKIKTGKLGKPISILADAMGKVTSAIKGLVREGRMAINAKRITGLTDKALRITAVLKDDSKILVIWKGDDIVRIEKLHPGTLGKDRWVGIIGEEAGEAAMAAGFKSRGMTGAKIFRGNADEVIKYNNKYVLAFAEDGKNVKVWDRVANKVVMQNGKIISRRYRWVKEIDRLAVINNKYPVIAEFKTGRYGTFTDEIRIYKLKKGMDAVEELYGQKPHIIIGTAKGQAYGVGSSKTTMKPALKAVEDNLGGTVFELPKTPSEFRKMAEIITENYRRLDGR
jgi:hypothetical protein